MTGRHFLQGHSCLKQKRERDGGEKGNERCEMNEKEV